MDETRGMTRSGYLQYSSLDLCGLLEPSTWMAQPFWFRPILGMRTLMALQEVPQVGSQ